MTDRQTIQPTDRVSNRTEVTLPISKKICVVLFLKWLYKASEQTDTLNQLVPNCAARQNTKILLDGYKKNFERMERSSRKHF